MPRRVQVHEHLDGHLSVHYAGRCLTITAAPLEAPKLRARQGARGGGTVAADSQTPAQPWCSCLQQPRLSWGSRRLVQRSSQLLTGGQLPIMVGASRSYYPNGQNH
jgi:hypothetical protein